MSARFDVSVAYYKCASYGQVQWVIDIDNSAQPLSIFGISLKDFSLHATGSPLLATSNTTSNATVNSTYWAGTVSGTLDFGGETSLSATGTISFDSINGVSALQTATTFNSEYVDITFNLDYHANTPCKNATFDAYNASTYVGSSGSGSITIKSIFVLIFYIYIFLLVVIFYYYIFLSRSNTLAPSPSYSEQQFITIHAMMSGTWLVG